jgi:hypothetical protein
MFEWFIASLPCLFGCHPKNMQNTPFRLAHKIGDADVTVMGHWRLGPVALKVLQVLLALAPTSGPGNQTIALNGQVPGIGETGRSHLETLGLEGDAVALDSLVVRSSLYEVSKELGYSGSSFDSGYQIKVIRRALDHLSGVYVKIVHNDADGTVEGFNLISHHVTSAKKDGGFTVALNPRLAAGILGKRRYSRLEMAEVRALKSDQARLVHHRLCGYIDPGKTRCVTMDTLCGYVWTEQTANLKTLSKRRFKIKAALTELTGLGWSVVEYAEGKFRIVRRPTAN